MDLTIETQRLLIKPPSFQAAKDCNAAINDSFDALHRWMWWAKERPSVDDTKAFVKLAMELWKSHEEMPMWIFERANGSFIGGVGFHECKWDTGQVEIGYWIRSSASGKGFMTEAVNAITRYAFEALHARRIEIRCQEGNLKSTAVALRLGYVQEHVPCEKQPVRQGRVCQLLYVRKDAAGLPPLDVIW